VIAGETDVSGSRVADRIAATSSSGRLLYVRMFAQMSRSGSTSFRTRVTPIPKSSPCSRADTSVFYAYGFYA